MNLYEFLLQYRDSGRLPMHMPGHKRQPPFSMEDPYGLDVTEVEGTDNLHHPEGRIRRLMDQMRKMYGTRESYLLVNGSTCGILAVGVLPKRRQGSGGQKLPPVGVPRDLSAGTGAGVSAAGD